MRRSERSSCGCTGVSLSDRTGHGDKRGQIFYRNTNRLSLAFAGERGVCVIADIVKTRQEKTNNKRGIGNRGKTKIVVKEHFSEKGKTMEELLTDVMLEKAKQTIA